jgi:hypothetical protein
VLRASPQAYDILRAGGLLVDAPSESHLKKLRAQEGGCTGQDRARYEALAELVKDLTPQQREVRACTPRPEPSLLPPRTHSRPSASHPLLAPSRVHSSLPDASPCRAPQVALNWDEISLVGSLAFKLVQVPPSIAHGRLSACTGSPPAGRGPARPAVCAQSRSAARREHIPCARAPRRADPLSLTLMRARSAGTAGELRGAPWPTC